MGACASMPKVLKGDKSKGKVKAPEPMPEKVVVVEKEKKKDDAVKAMPTIAMAVKEEIKEEVKKVEDGGAAGDEKVTRSSSLGDFFKKNQEKEASSQTETVKESDVSEVKPTEAAVTFKDVVQPAEDVKPAAASDQESATPLVDAPAKEEEAKPTAEEAAAVVVDAAAKTIQPEEVKAVVEKVKDAVKSDEKPDEKSEKSEEKKQEESYKSVTEEAAGKTVQPEEEKAIVEETKDAVKSDEKPGEKSEKSEEKKQEDFKQDTEAEKDQK